jgi:hypothetical protein
MEGRKMNLGKTVFAKIVEHVPRYEFDKSVNRYQGHYRHHRYSCYNKFLCLAFVNDRPYGAIARSINDAITGSP